MSTPLRRHRAGPADRAVREAEQAAAEAIAENQRMRRALDAVSPAIVVHDEHGHLVIRNRRHAELDGNRYLSALVSDVVERLMTDARTGHAGSQLLELHGPPPRTLDISAEPLDGPDGPIGAIAFVDDVSERRRLEAIRRDFAANVSHELRTPIGALGVLAETLSDEDDPDVVRRLAQHLTTEAERAGRLIEDLLDLSRIEAGGVLIDDVVTVDGLAEAAAQRVAPAAVQRDVKVLVSLTETDAAVLGDERQLVSAVVNLLDNAIKYSEPGSTVELEARSLDEEVEIEVRDQGIGIPPSDLERVFERFYRVDRARSRETGGTGLGLSIVRHVASNHGGTVSVQSREGEGSAFTLRLPRLEP